MPRVKIAATGEVVEVSATQARYMIGQKTGTLAAGEKLAPEPATKTAADDKAKAEAEAKAKAEAEAKAKAGKN